MGSTTNTLATIIVIGLVVILVFAWWKGYFPIGDGADINQPSWQIVITSEPIYGGTTTPSGLNSIAEHRALTVTASSSEGYTFSHWVFDNITGYTQPVLTIPSQLVNSTHSLVAVFLAKIQLIEISPSKTLTVGSSFTFALDIKNNVDADLYNFEMKLNDPNGVFKIFYVVTQNVYRAGTYQADIENKWSQSLKGPYIAFTLDLFKTDYLLPAHSTKQFYVGIRNLSQVSPTIPAGTYHLSFSLRFTVANGTFQGPPELTVPWEVTILG